MAHLTGLIKFLGTLDGHTAYVLNGKIILRTVGKVSKDRRLNDPAFLRQRQNMNEFGAASKISKAIRDACQPLKGPFFGPYISARL